MENMDFRTRKTSAAAMFILSAIMILMTAFVYFKFFYIFRDQCGRDFIAAFQYSPIWVILFGVCAIFWMLLSISTLIKYRKLKRDFGPTAGAIVGSILIVLEYIGFALFIAFLFI